MRSVNNSSNPPSPEFNTENQKGESVANASRFQVMKGKRRAGQIQQRAQKYHASVLNTSRKFLTGADNPKKAEAAIEKLDGRITRLEADIRKLKNIHTTGSKLDPVIKTAEKSLEQLKKDKRDLVNLEVFMKSTHEAKEQIQGARSNENDSSTCLAKAEEALREADSSNIQDIEIKKMADQYVEDLQTWTTNISKEGRKASFVSNNPRPRNWFDKVLKFFPSDPPGSSLSRRPSERTLDNPRAEKQSNSDSVAPNEGVSGVSGDSGDSVVEQLGKDQPKSDETKDFFEAVKSKNPKDLHTSWQKLVTAADGDSQILQNALATAQESDVDMRFCMPPECKGTAHRANERLLAQLPDSEFFIPTRQLLQRKIAEVNAFESTYPDDVQLADVAREVEVKDGEAVQLKGVLKEIKTSTENNIENLEKGIAKLRDVLNNSGARKALFKKDIPGTKPELVEGAIQGLELFLVKEKEIQALLEVALPEDLADVGAGAVNLGDILNSSVFSEYTTTGQSVVQVINLAGEGATNAWGSASRKLPLSMEKAPVNANAIFILPTQRLPRWQLLLKEVNKKLVLPDESAQKAPQGLQQASRRTGFFMTVFNEATNWSDRYRNLLQMSSREVGRMRSQLALKGAIEIAKDFQDTQKVLIQDPAGRSFEDISPFTKEEVGARVQELARKGKNEIRRNVLRFRDETYRREHSSEVKEFIENVWTLADGMVVLGKANDRAAALEVFGAPDERELNQWEEK